jgi:mono/diheme cytochrome c family protein
LACSKTDSGSGTATSTTATNAPPKVTASGATIYKERCAACHGAEGKGDGAAAATLNPKPRDHTDKKWQASVTDEEIKKTILLGGTGVGKSPMMPGSPDLEGSPETVAELVKIVRGFGGK